MILMRFQTKLIYYKLDQDVNSNPDNIFDINLETQSKSQYRINYY